jgi:hypothetical protein
MVMGKRESGSQAHLFVTVEQVLKNTAHPFYEQVNKLLDHVGFDACIQQRCRKLYAQTRGAAESTTGSLLSLPAVELLPKPVVEVPGRDRLIEPLVEEVLQPLVHSLPQCLVAHP